MCTGRLGRGAQRLGMQCQGDAQRHQHHEQIAPQEITFARF
jgi:hypothetical protein